MIQLKELAKPQVLVDNALNWTKTVMDYVNKGQKIPDSDKNKYNHIQVKNQIKLETKEKCAYCESQVTHQYPGDIEHIIPKAIYPRLTFNWSNLTFACYWCNNGKRNYVEKKEAKLINPYKDKISEHLSFFGPLLMHVNESKRGEITWKKIKLNRQELIDRRTEKIIDLQNLIDKYEREDVPALKAILLNEVIEFSNNEKEFSYMCICYLQDKKIL
ncbi:HNH endonuclease [Aquimarina sp. AU58]|uniref:HNH endonuclease n=1 Tax=Aquimarina sp. AU58 TaxID=1874112 RepID=UPI000D64F724|nr:HNH endonuclease [Aquimarina sp. AU58]